MNRKKKINQELKKRQKQANSKVHHSNKPKYISKAERERIAQEQAQLQNQTDEASPTNNV
ncbi:DUF2986 domain-containing protein [Motilimonas sp. E26]|uniref:DUF2986 domain-containing protein n=1 Tax=Motilimonas TaxID=1914248 RepID=UPI001E4D001D|nr:DUF2986 domain-containing protein [Motilimonas sp. E26]MCE0555383.1 DUF2986 domain-containing protein [Motilimonas sp. E26]